MKSGAAAGFTAIGRSQVGAALRRLLDLTDGNLVRHLQLLVEVGYADVVKVYRGRCPHSLYAATPQGHAAFAAHIAALEGIIAGAQGR